MIIDIVLGKAIGRGGLELVLTLVSKELELRGHRVRVFQAVPPDFMEWANTLSEIYYYDMLSKEEDQDETNADTPDLVRYVVGYRSLLTKLGTPDLVLATHTPLFSLMCRVALEPLGDACPPIISWLHGPPEVYGSNGEILNQSDGHLAISKTIGSKIKALVKDSSSVFYVGNPIPDYSSTFLFRNPDCLKLVYIGRIDNGQKRLDVLFQGLSQLQGEWTLTLVGDGSDVEALKDLSVQLGIDSRLEWAGWKEDPWASIEGASLLVLSSDYEGLPMVLIESLSRGLPVISTEIDGANEVVQPGINGWLYPREDFQAINNILQSIINKETMLPSPQVCVDSVQKYHVVNVVNRMEEAFRNSFTSLEKKSNDRQLEVQISDWATLGLPLQEYILNELEQLIKTSDDSADYAFALKLIKQIESIDSNNTALNVVKARILSKQGQKGEIFNFLLEMERANPNKRAGLFLAELYDEMGSRIKALKQYALYVEEEDRVYLQRMRELLEDTSKPQISLLTYTNSGCNATTLLRLMPDYISQKYEVRLFWEGLYEELDDFIKESDMVVTTQANYPFNNKQFNIELWHGFPLKAMMNMDHGELRSSKHLNEFFEKADRITSYSSMFNTLFNACVGTRISRYQITGAPRNDLLNRDNRDWFSKFFGCNLNNQKIILFSPTFRAPFFNPSKNEGDRTWENLFGFEQFDQREFERYLEENNLFIVVKLHPVEESRIQEQVIYHNNSRVKLLTQVDIAEEGMDFYELLGSIDLLITDYSSIFFDYLLLNRPILFTPVDLETYKGKRGLLLQPYDHWTPGPKAYNQKVLQEEMKKSLSNSTYFEVERLKIKEVVHYFNDFSSSQRVWELIDSELDLQGVSELTNQFLIDGSKGDQIKGELKKCIEKNRIEEGRELFLSNKDLMHIDSELHTIAATIFFLNNEIDESEKHLLKAYEMSPTYFDAIYNLALVYEQSKDYETSMKYYKESLNYCRDRTLRNQIKLKLNSSSKH
ncbi:CDP-glycerol glycerophosphotransferase family protein [Paenibacillus polymyxa]|uniref:CDP-glycerol glycerophosphotransferase family protein n=1 Tax=Paenibacillus polymyxa TaxID=1406 RepID=UPI000737B49B|nr:CDP-glycerol glycerophosphotransferase family protein [Paenibacillus polymyxa]